MKKYPLTHWQEAGRQIVCYFLGHRWRSSWCRRPQPIVERRKPREGTEYARHVSSWYYKCRRCRMRIRSDSYYPWYRYIWWACRDFMRCLWIGVTCSNPWSRGKPGFGYSTIPFQWWLLDVFVGAPLFALGQSWAYMHCDLHLPWFPGGWALDAHSRFADFNEKHTTHYRWMPPDSGRPDEVGFHLRADLPTEPRMRVYFINAQEPAEVAQ